MVLSDRSIKEEIARGRIVIMPLDLRCIQPASIDVHLGSKLLAFKTWRHPFYIDVRQNADDLTEPVEIGEEAPLFLNPGEFVLATTMESITLPDDIVGRLEGKSSLGRIGLLIHSTAGYIDPGWQGHLTLELSNVAKLPVTLYRGMKIGQVSFIRLTSAVERPYGSEGLGSKYQGQTEPTASRYYQDFGSYNPERAADYMERALSLARQALGQTSPNPAVGAVIVREGKIVGEGYTQPPGSAHAEVVALGQAQDQARGAIMYTTLEPCCHFGRTPPCTRAILAAGIAEVHMATLDPNPIVSGKGKAELELAGIRTYSGDHEAAARELNEAYIKFITTGLPFVTAKFAMSLDGKMATRTGDSRWISGEESRQYVHKLRQGADAIMVGVSTVLADDPQLTPRVDGTSGDKKLLRVIVDSHGHTPPTAQVFQSPGKTLLAVAAPLDEAKASQLKGAGAEVLELPSEDGLVDLSELLKALGQRGITSVLVEGGGTLLASLFDLGLIDKVVAFVAPIIIGGVEAVTPVGGKGIARIAEALRLQRVRIEKLGTDVLVSGYLVKER